MNKLSLPMRSCKFGAPMGHSNQLPENIYLPIKLQMEKLKWIDNDYICDGTYFGGGSGDYIYCAFIQDQQEYITLKSNIPAENGVHYGPAETFQVKIFVRAKTRLEAKLEVWGYVPNARFYN
jgi:hypothetical protein